MGCCKKLFVVVLCLAFFGLPAVVRAQLTSGTEIEALEAIISSVSGLPPEWQTGSAASACDPVAWPGLRCVDKVGPIVELVLTNQAISGTIPDQIWGLSSLTKLTITGTGLGGSIPATICGLTDLAIITLQNNPQMLGPIPGCIGTNLMGLTDLILAGSQFSGPIPDTLGSLQNLVTLSLEANQLDGEIPITLGGLSLLQNLRLHGNLLSGAIPKELGSLTNLAALYLGNNQFSGPLPATIESLANLVTLDIRANPDLIGCFMEPPSLTECSLMETSTCSCHSIKCTPECSTGCTTCDSTSGSPPPQNAPQASPQMAPQLAPQKAPEAAPQSAPQSAPASLPAEVPPPAVAPSAAPEGPVPTVPPQQSITCDPNTNSNCLGTVVLGNSSTGPSQIIISNQTVVQGDFIAQSPNVTVSIVVSNSGGTNVPLVITGCATFNGVLNVSIGENTALNGSQATTIPLSTFAGGYCDAQGNGQPTTQFSELNVDLGCRTATNQELIYQPSSLNLLLGGVDSSQCQQPEPSSSSSTAPLTPTIVVAVVVPILVVLAILLILLVVFRRKIIPAYRYEDTSKTELAALDGAKSS